MDSNEVVSFAEALDDSESRPGGRNVLLGNGFSIDWNPEIFRYESLYEEAELASLSVSKQQLFESLDTHDFESVVQYLKTASKLADMYGGGDSLVKALRRDAQVVRRGLSDVLAKRHPPHSYDPSDDEVEHARAFLSNFGRIFTLNYDLLLYWVLNRDAGSEHLVQKGDGFEWPTYDGPKILVWKSSAAERGQRVFYLHGALHYFVDSDLRLRKLSYSGGGALVDQIRERVEDGNYPLLVTEGASKEKEARIQRSAYLRYCYGRLCATSGSLFSQGVSISSNDRHIFNVLESKDSQVEALYVSVFGSPDDEKNEETIQAARAIVRRRSKNGGKNLSLFFYDASSAHVWRS